jgi:6-phosphofructokinase
MTHRRTLAILVGGGPAPGINSVISAATIRSLLAGVEVLGIRDGFEHIMQGDIDCVMPLGAETASMLHFTGGSIIGTARANPTRNPQHLENSIASLRRLGVTQLITIGGDDTAFSALKLAEESAGSVRVVHVPKTIDNDLDLPPHIDTFGFQTARHVGTNIIKSLMVDACTTSRWYIVVAMGRSAGYLALGMGKAAGATVTLIPEEFADAPVRLKTIVDTLVGAIIKRMSEGRRDGVAVVAEGVVLGIDPNDLAGLKEVERDAHGNIRLAEVDFGAMLKRGVTERLQELDIKNTVVAKDIGYELRCADPIAYDLEYTRELGYCAANHLLEGGNAVMVSMQGGQFVPIPFAQLLDPKTGRTKIRRVDVHSSRYAIARRYMTRLRREDFQNADQLGKLAHTAGISADEFRRQFEHLTENEPPQTE